MASAIMEPTSDMLAGRTKVLLAFASSPNSMMYCSAIRKCQTEFLLEGMPSHFNFSFGLVEPVPGDNLVTTTRTHARRVLGAFVFFTLLGIVFLLGLHVEPFHAITLTLAAISTGGFSVFNDSLGGLESMPAASVVLFISLCGAISLPLYARTYRDGFHRVTSDVELPTLLLCVLATVLIGLSLRFHTNLDWSEAMTHGAALAVSA
jgi:trk system potassium uptake protein TrkH